ncbi:MAG: hypothetical protein H7234_10300 [Herminiimonas sp.]|nr:hypothetical protein [Herminiimonas sp.]
MDATVHGGFSPYVATRLGRCVLALSCCLAVATGCSRKPARGPTSPQPPRPQIAPDGQLKSLLGNAVLSNALLSYKLQCTEPTANVRVCHAPPEIAQRHAIGGT